MKFAMIRAVVMDMDGVLWRGDDPLPGMIEMFEWLRESETPFALATNNSSKTQSDYVAKLTRMGVDDVPESAIVTSATATAAYLHGQFPAGTPLHVVGMSGLRRILDGAGFDLSGDELPQAVVAGMDLNLTYETLKQAALYIRSGVPFIGTNPDLTFPSPEGLIPGTGSLLAALEAATDVSPTVIGKPRAPMFDTALATLGTSAAETLMIGDRLNTDILGAQRVGMPTTLLFTGVTTPDALSDTNNDIWPDVAYEGLPALISAWAGDAWYRQKIKAKRGH